MNTRMLCNYTQESGGLKIRTKIINTHIADFLMNHSRLDQHIYWATVDTEHPANGKCLCKLSIHAETPEQIQIQHHGQAETAFQCGVWNSPGGVTWLTMDADRLVIWGKGKIYPIFITQQALNNLRQFAKRFGRYRGRVINYIWHSLERTEVVRRHDGSIFVEPTLVNRSLGVFMGMVMNGKFVIIDYTSDWKRNSPVRKQIIEAVREMKCPWDMDTDGWRGRKAS
jgi:hypothetical protein